jgi:hypothetical protein
VPLAVGRECPSPAAPVVDPCAEVLDHRFELRRAALGYGELIAGVDEFPSELRQLRVSVGDPLSLVPQLLAQPLGSGEFPRFALAVGTLPLGLALPDPWPATPLRALALVIAVLGRHVDRPLAAPGWSGLTPGKQRPPEYPDTTIIAVHTCGDFLCVECA